MAIVNDRFDLAATLLDLGADANDGSLYFAVDMHDATTDMRARDGSRLRADHPNKLTALDLVKLLLDRGADPNKAFVGQLHSTSLCCGDDINASPFYRAAVASDVEVLKLMIAHGAEVEWSPTEVKKAKGPRPVAARTPTSARRRSWSRWPVVGARRSRPVRGSTASDRRRSASRRTAIRSRRSRCCWRPGRIRTPRRRTARRRCTRRSQARQVAIIRTLVAAGGSLSATNKDNLTPLQLAEKPPRAHSGVASGSWRIQPKRDTREEVIAALRELMKLGPNDPAPVPPPAEPDKKDETKKEAQK